VVPLRMKYSENYLLKYFTKSKLCMTVKSKEDMEGLMAAGSAVANVLKKMTAYAEIGMSTKEIDEYGGKLLAEYDCSSAPMRDYKFPGYTCISVNHEVCHVIALETFISTKANFVQQQKDGWTMMSKDKSFVTQHEHTIIVRDGFPILTTIENGVSEGYYEHVN